MYSAKSTNCPGCFTLKIVKKLKERGKRKTNKNCKIFKHIYHLKIKRIEKLVAKVGLSSIVLVPL